MLVKWQGERKKWHQGKTRQKMAAESHSFGITGQSYFRGGDFGLNEVGCHSHISSSFSCFSGVKPADLSPADGSPRSRNRRRWRLQRRRGR
jgi:hypothetical protein